MTFGDFNYICNQTALPLCQVVSFTKPTDYQHLNNGIVPICYARSIELANTVIFQIGNAFANIAGLGVFLIIIYHIRSKYTAIGRLEMLFYYNLLLALNVCSLVVDCGVSPPGSKSYPYLVAVQLGLISASCWALMICGLLGFRIWEDGTKRSMWFIRLSSFAYGGLTFIISLLTFQDWIKNGTLDRSNTMGLFVLSYLFNAILLATFIVCQTLLAIFLIKNYWVIGVIALVVISFVAGQVILYGFSRQICENVKHYLDGLFFASLCNIFANMMLYKFWDMTTDDDLEFSISINEDGDVLYADK
ncbi:Chitin synthase export chaperone [Wickerhamomyces ciferrii]|uniref:Chitin synthase export chaperone n=1 Tax=Wickerhamomyces ciferrii (strain ATCC 14091 / BCRC 22168 / CBS 111 / JCM 3599 / NBRC 0793 / NRRL Y-1031 F-60-10) TaxID=1206466 RepID=K0KRZ2_WICCF|nr:Chitin synthase export chaperone [Wickerhamomyces ciferrii]CCH45921.1 Chitin synthase export chaperone [Wickerhamomyces ciferrii]